MTQIIENWSLVTGTIQQINPHQTLKDYFQLHLLLEKSADVALFPNLARLDIGKSIIINLKKEELDKNGWKVGNTIQHQIRKAAGQVYFAY